MTALTVIEGAKGKTATRRAELFAALAQEDAQTFLRAMQAGNALLHALDELDGATTQKAGVRERAERLRAHVAGELASIQALADRR